MPRIILFIVLVLVACVLAVSVTTVKTTFAIAAVLGVAVFIVSFVSTEAAIYVLIFSMLLSPEYGQRDTSGGGLTLRGDDFLLLLIGFSWFARAAIHKELGLFLKTSLNSPIRYYILACFVSTAWAFLAGRVTMKGFFFIVKYIEYFIVYFMVVNHIRRREQIRSYYLAALATCAIVSVIAIAQIPSGERVSAPFDEEPNTLGGYLVLMMSLVLGVLATKGFPEVPGGRLFLLGLFGMMVVVITATQSRGSWMAATVMTIAFIRIFSGERVVSEKRVKLLFIFGALAVFLAVFAPKKIINQVKGRFFYTFETYSDNPWVGEYQEKIGGVTLDTSASARIRDWKTVLKDFPNHPFLGYGVRGWAKGRFLDGQYALVLIETGVFGILAFLVFLGAIFRELWRVYHQVTDDPLYRGIALGTLVGFAALIVHALTANTFMIVRIMEPFWLFTGMVVVMPRLREGQVAEEVVMVREAQGL
ncbi:MAG: O-antigen ligase family protein [Candidatus Latescibacteria bacterium]|nr:O-antigen ligase family protein [Candidatus Latescibacterota bacterium]